MADIGLIGVGTMGKMFVEKIEDSDRSLLAYDLDDDQLAYATERGGEAADSSAELAERADVVLLSLPSNRAVEAAMEADDGVLSGLTEGTIVVDTGTTKPSISRRYARLCEKAGGGFLEAPLTRGGNITMMVGGEKEYYERARPVFDVVAGNHRLIGDIGQGQTLKLMRQIIGAGYDAACAEAIELGRASGVDPELLNDYLDMDVEDRFFGDDFEVTFEGGVGAMTLRSKDLACAIDVANEVGAATPITNAASEAHKTAAVHKPDPREPWFHEGIVTYWRLLNRTDPAESR